MHFKKLIINGFGCIEGTIEFSFKDKGLTIFKAGNGVGKTTIPSAFFWCLYGDTIKEKSTILTWPHLRSTSYKGTLVEVYWENEEGDEFYVARCKEYTGQVNGAKGKNRVVFLINGEEPIEEYDLDEKKDINKAIINELGYSKDLFKNSIIFGQKLKRLIQETGPKKKELFTELIETQFIDKARDIEQQEYKSIDDLYRTKKSELDSIKGKVDLINTNLSKIDEEKIQFEQNKKNQIKLLENKLKDWKNLKIEQLKGWIKVQSKWKDKEEEDTSDLIKSIASKEAVLKSYNKDLQNYQKDLKKYRTELGDILDDCPECGRPFDKESIQVHKDNLQKRIDKEINNISKIQNNIDKDKKVLLEEKSLLSSKQSTNKSISTYKEKLNELEKLKSKDKVEKDKLKYKIENIKSQEYNSSEESLKSSLKSLKPQLRKLRKDTIRIKKQLDIKKWLINNPLANTGLKMFIFESYIDKINDNLNLYSKFIGFKVIFNIDLSTKKKDLEVAISKNNQFIPYSDLSGGQQQLVDVAVAFAMNDLVIENNEINILILDEVFESLDTSNVEKVGDIIQDKANYQNIILITHLKDFVSLNSSYVDFEYKKGILKNITKN